MLVCGLVSGKHFCHSNSVYAVSLVYPLVFSVPFLFLQLIDFKQSIRCTKYSVSLSFFFSIFISLQLTRHLIAFRLRPLPD